MMEHFYSANDDQLPLRSGPLAPHLDSFAARLSEQGYSKYYGRQKIEMVADLSQWLDRNHIPVANLNERRIDVFLAARSKGRCHIGGEKFMLVKLLRQLREDGLVPVAPPPAVRDPIDLIEREYGRFLSQERGLSQSTLHNYLPVARAFLSQRFGATKVRLKELQSKDATGFILHQASSSAGRGQAQRATCALRSFLRFLYQRGHLAINLSASVPTVAICRLLDLPHFLPPEQVERLLQSCDQSSPIGLRDYAVLLLLARLGLRAGEVVHLSLDAINWEAAAVLIRGKSSREDRLPLPEDVGQALANYLRNGRPECSSRRVFLRVNAPRQGFSSSVAICNIVRRALKRTGLSPHFKGAHLLRRSLATTMLRRGASLAQIGQILRHQQAQTTEIYAKVHLTALRALAQPWPGGAR
jgi:site-specific recombinase XerD